MTYDPASTYPRKRRRWPWIAIPLALVFCLAGVIFAVASGDDPAPTAPASVAPATVKPTTPSVQPTTPADPTPPADAKKPPAPPKAIAGDDLVHVGEDVPAGTYRAAEPVGADGLCYWSKAKDAEGADIIDNDVPTGGRPQVTLKSGQWFKSQGCPEWRAK